MKSENEGGKNATERIGRDLFLFFLLLNLLFTGGRMPSSDETSVFLLTQSIATRGAFDIPPGVTENGSFFGEKYYSWYEAGQALVAVPFYYVAVLATRLLPLPERFDLLAIKAFMSLFNAVIGGLIAVVFFAFSERLGASRRAAFLLTVGLCVGTNLFPYLKSFLREPLLTLCLLASVYYLFSYHTGQRDRRYLVYAGFMSGLGFLAKVTFAMNVFFLFLYVLVIVNPRRSKEWLVNACCFLAPVLLAGAGILLYNYARFSDVLDLGYRAGTNFTTPLYVGLYGQLFSSGKSLFLYAPIAVLVFWAFAPFYRSNRDTALLFLSLILGNLVLHGMYMSWAGEGSWGVRYLLPILPYMILPLAVLFRERSRFVKPAATGLVALGLLIQTGGIAIYLGNYYREIGEYPYKRNFDDPEFMYRSHFIPNYSPIIGHWKMLVRNAGEHLAGDIPTISLSDDEQLKRIPLQSQEQPKLLHTFDFWFMYPIYAGLSPVLPLAALALLAGVFLLQTTRLRRHLRKSQPEPRGESPA